jgi:hypothetical protein
LIRKMKLVYDRKEGVTRVCLLRRERYVMCVRFEGNVCRMCFLQRERISPFIINRMRSVTYSSHRPVPVKTRHSEEADSHTPSGTGTRSQHSMEIVSY